MPPFPSGLTREGWVSQTDKKSPRKTILRKMSQGGLEPGLVRDEVEEFL